VPPDTPTDAVIELVVIVEGENIPTREFAMYLSLIDRLYGRLSPGGLMSYAHRESGHLEIAEIHKSQLEIIFRALFDHYDAVRLVVILMFLKSLPNMFKLMTEGVKNLAEAHKSYEETKLLKEKTGGEGRLLRALTDGEGGLIRVKGNIVKAGTNEEGVNEGRSELVSITALYIREVLEQEPAVEKLAEPDKSRLVELLDALVAEENPNLPAPLRFARRQVRGLTLRIRKPDSG
jgi:hypothetical protein